MANEESGIVPQPGQPPAQQPPDPPTPLTAKKKDLKKPIGTYWTGILVVFFTVLMIILAWNLQGYGGGQNYLAVMGSMIAIIITLGFGISGRWDGILVTDRNLISLSRFQMIVWTVIILGAYLTAVIGRIKTKDYENAMSISLDKTLWGLLGISTASLIGTPMLQTSKMQETPNQAAVISTAEKNNETVAAVSGNAQGVLYANTSIQDAAFSDMFEGDEVGNTSYIDPAKLQMFFFTVITALSYSMELYQWISHHSYRTQNFPLVSSSLIAILGISHAGYLANKTTTHTPTQ